MLKKIFCGIAALILFHTQIFAYGPIGHRVVAEIAERHLSRHARHALKDLIGKEKLAFWASWPDFIKSDTTGKWKAAYNWHFVDVPGHLNREELITSLKDLKGDNLYTKIPDLMAQLKNKNLPIEQRRQALYFLIHCMGDLHQPLHVGRPDDWGGNKIKVKWFHSPTNLHAVWDDKLVNYQQYSYTEYATVLDIASKAEQKQITNSSLEDWFFESHKYSDLIYDDIKPNEDLGYAYDYKFVHILNKELLEGGLRLAKLLNEVL